MKELDVPPYSFYRVPEPHQMAAQLIRAIPENEREDATEILVEHILPIKLAGIEHHPRPQRMSAVVYREIARVLSSRPSNMRLHALRSHAFEVYIQYMVRESSSIAIARFLLSHPDIDQSSLGPWRTAQVEELCGLDVDDVVDIAQRSLEGVQQWREAVVDGYPAEWPKQKSKYKLVHATLTTAVSGDYTRAGGQLCEFLRAAGEQPDELA